ncbi:MAG: sulfotransferase [Actinomycetota bacterium]|nr:sulfotransferase [Actinomycetota bacterium]
MTSSATDEGRASGGTPAPALERPKVVYVAGWGRSGSTLLSAALGELPGFVALGETHNMWRSGVVRNRACGCRQPFSDCEHWSQVLATARGADPDFPAVDDIVTAQAHAARTRHLPLVATPLGSRVRDDAAQRYLRAIGGVYRAVVERTGARVLVDSSKEPVYGRLLEHLDIEFFVVHLVRDPRAVAYSWLRRKERFRVAAGEQPSYMHRHGPLTSSTFWLAWNAIAGAFWRRRLGRRYLLVRYEDFIADPAATLTAVLQMVQEPVESLPLSGPSELLLAPNHMVSGNPSRFSTGPVQLKEDNEWRTALLPAIRRRVELATWPLLLRYGYPLRQAPHRQ